MKRYAILAAGLVFVFLLSVFTAACGSQQAAESADPTVGLQPETGAVSVASDGKAADGQINFGSFTTADLEGNEVTEAIFARKEYTMINMWGTFCPPCIAEMPELQELAEILPDNFQIIGLISDLAYESPDENVRQEAEEIVSSAGVTYPNLLIWQDSMELISSLTSYVPTTFFVDSEGNLVGDPIIGAEIDTYKDRIVELSK